ncbi:hypothetical protein TMatcc_008121 [Talaromyces marneffei ATCC 18224]|uniref:uncharacterized protein n=1 Tax=Talaromyces marneffei TaxID=37727 RepID=UPI0012AA0704|nr:uncharacterized protein EYB26_005012 [Talaromyces marneffei]KAE8552520.1 hypothetical protein EYB25_003898 [Talaromyces marneffei]QGA17341.1 hypothetical protein EYB26_005012 [Talaromyces marneffei]
MKFLPSLIVFGLSAQALASPYVDHYATKDQHDLKDYKSVIEDISQAVKQFNTDINNYGGGDISPLLTDLNTIIQVITQGIQKLQSQPSLLEMEAGILLIAVQGVKGQILSAIEALIRSKELLVTGGFGSEILQCLQKLQQVAMQFGGVVSPKIPYGEVGDTYQQVSDQIMQAIQRAIDDFSPGPGPGPTSTSSKGYYCWPWISSYAY